MPKKTADVSVEQIPGLLLDQGPAGFAVWTREAEGDWELVREDFKTVEDLGHYIHELQLAHDHQVVIREHGHRPGMKPLLELMQEAGVLQCDCDKTKTRHK